MNENLEKKAGMQDTKPDAKEKMCYVPDEFWEAGFSFKELGYEETKIREAFERIRNDPEKMKYYEQDPILKATFMAFYNYVKEGNLLIDLGWFAVPVKVWEDVKNKIRVRV